MSQELSKEIVSGVSVKASINAGKIDLALEADTSILIDLIEAHLVTTSVLGQVEKGALEVIRAAVKVV